MATKQTSKHVHKVPHIRGKDGKHLLKVSVSYCVCLALTLEC